MYNNHSAAAPDIPMGSGSSAAAVVFSFLAAFPPAFSFFFLPSFPIITGFNSLLLIL